MNKIKKNNLIIDIKRIEELQLPFDIMRDSIKAQTIFYEIKKDIKNLSTFIKNLPTFDRVDLVITASFIIKIVQYKWVLTSGNNMERINMFHDFEYNYENNDKILELIHTFIKIIKFKYATEVYNKKLRQIEDDRIDNIKCLMFNV